MQGVLSAKYAPLAIQGTMLHMVNHSLIKLLLFLVAGAVFVNIRELDFNKIRGFGRGKPLLAFSFLMGALGVIGIPLWNGYISKKLLQKSIVYHIETFPDYSAASAFFQSLEGIFTLTGGLTTAYMIKIFICLFVEKNQFDHRKMTAFNKRYLTVASAAVLLLCAIMMPVLGFSPYAFMMPMAAFGQSFMQGTDFYTQVSFYDVPTLIGALPSLAIGAVVYLFIVRGCLMAKDEEGRSVYLNLWPVGLDIEMRIYRPLLLNVLPFIGALIARTVGGIVTGISVLGYTKFLVLRSFWHAKCKEDWLNEIMSDFRAFLRSLDAAQNWGIMERTKEGLDNLNTQTWDVMGKVKGGIDGVNARPKELLDGVGDYVENYKLKTMLNTLGYSMQLCLMGVAVVLVLVVLFQ